MLTSLLKDLFEFVQFAIILSGWIMARWPQMERRKMLLSVIWPGSPMHKHSHMNSIEEEPTSLGIMQVWTPSLSESSVAESVESSQKINKIAGVEANSHDIDTGLRNAWTGLRNTWLGQLYKGHLKRYVFVRRIARWIRRNGYSLYLKCIAVRLFNRTDKRWRSLIKLNDFAKRSEVSIYKFADATVVEIPAPTVFPACDHVYLASPNDRYKFPEIYVASIKNAMTYGGTNLILVDNEVICHDLYNFEHDYTSEEQYYHVLIEAKSSRIRWLMSDKVPESIPAAATFVDACATNYAHWMTEVLPRVAMFCAEERFHGVPIVVNDGLHKNIMESLFLVAGAEREIITLPTGKALAIDELYVTSVTGYVPFERRTTKLSGHSHGIFSPHALALVRKHMGAFFEKAELQEWPEKIFLRRNSGIRKFTNAAEIEKIMVNRGYAIVEAENLTFSQQVQLFTNANIIVAPTGAALVNAIFCKPATQVAVLMAKHENMIYRYWSNMLTPIRIKVSYILGNIVDNRQRGLHGDFVVNTNDIIDLLETLENK